jgi:hypothetical protein
MLEKVGSRVGVGPATLDRLSSQPARPKQLATSRREGMRSMVICEFLPAKTEIRRGAGVGPSKPVNQSGFGRGAYREMSSLQSAD